MEMYNTTGAAVFLGCSGRWIQKLVLDKRLKAYMYDDRGVLITRNEALQGRALFFKKEDLASFKADPPLKRPGRHKGSKNKPPIAVVA